jgi:hypothetical protein
MKFLAPIVLVVLGAVSLGAAATKPAAEPQLTLRANRSMAFAPVRIMLTAVVKGGPDNYEDLYCPTVEWDWGDGTISSSSSDCSPYNPATSTIRRIYIVEHVFKHGGDYTVTLRLRQQEKVVALAVADLNLSSALGDDGRDNGDWGGIGGSGNPGGTR